MKKNGFESLADFCKQYEQGDWTTCIIDGKEIIHWGGLEFQYDHKYYRLNRFASEANEFPILQNGKKAQYEVFICHRDTCDFSSSDFYTRIGFYASMNDLLENCYIDGKKFKTVIVDKNTILEGQD